MLVVWGLSLQHERRKYDYTDTTFFEIEGVYQWMKYMTPQSRIHSYYGLGPLLSYKYTDSSGIDSDLIGLGGIFSLGAEYYLVPTVSIFGEYDTYMIYYDEVNCPHISLGITLYMR